MMLIIIRIDYKSDLQDKLLNILKNAPNLTNFILNPYSLTNSTNKSQANICFPFK